MRYLFSSFVFLTVGLLAMSALAADKEAKKGDGDKRAEMREKMLQEFDADKDGKLSDDERAKAKEKMQELRAAKGDRPKGDRPEGKRPRDGRGPEGRSGGPGGPGDRPQLPKPEELFAKFDKDSDEKLSKEEFMALADYVHEHMPPPPQGGPGFERRGPGGPGGPGFGRGPDGPPREGERRFRRPDGPPRGEGAGPRGDRRPDRPPRDGDNPPPKD